MNAPQARPLRIVIWEFSPIGGNVWVRKRWLPAIVSPQRARPLLYVAQHIHAAERALARWVGGYRRRFLTMNVTASFSPLVSPRIDKTVRTSRRLFPLGLRRQAINACSTTGNRLAHRTR